MGLDIYLYDGKAAMNKIPSAKYPDHLCNKAYLRSSYNQSGFDSVVPSLTGKDGFDWIFQPSLTNEVSYSEAEENEDDYGFYPTKEDLQESLERAKQLLEDLKACRGLRVTTVEATSFLSNIPANIDEKQAMALANQQLDEWEKKETKHPWSGGFSSRDGSFFLDKPLEVVALIPGRRTGILGGGVFPCVYAVYKADLTWYIQAAEITIEFIENALTMDKPRIVWSS